MASRREILRDLGGFLHAFGWLVQTTLENGLRSTLGRLVSRAAYLRREDPKLYQHWIERVERLPNASENATRSLDVLRLPGRPTNEWAHCLRNITDQPWVNQVYLVNTHVDNSNEKNGDPEITNVGSNNLGSNNVGSTNVDSTNVENTDVVDLTEFDCQSHDSVADALLAIEKSTSIGVIVISVPCLLRDGFGGGIVAKLATGIDCCLPDHDMMVDGQRQSPYFKPGFTRELAFDPAYAPVVAVSRNLFDRLEPSESHLQASCTQPLLRLAERPVHLPHIFVHLLESAPSWQSVGDEVRAGRISTRYLDFTTQDSHFPEIYPEVESELRVSILIPTRDRLDLLKECVDSIQRYKYRFDYEIIVMDNQSSEKRTLDWFSEQEPGGVVKRITCDYSFNWSRLNNDGFAQSLGDVVVLLNNDTVVIQPDWLDRLVMLVSQGDVATVGPLLLYPDRTIQHAGVVLGFGGFADHVFMGEPLDNRPKEITVSPLQRRDVMANTGACLAIRREVYQQLGGLNEKLMVAGDLDLCLRARQLGLRNLFDPGVRLIHKESKTRQKGLPRGDRDILTKVISETAKSGDPYYNSNLSLRSLSPMPVLDEGSAI